MSHLEPHESPEAVDVMFRCLKDEARDNHVQVGRAIQEELGDTLMVPLSKCETEQGSERAGDGTVPTV
jgi:hypothetical protein